VRIAYVVETDWAVYYLRGRKDIVNRLHEFQSQGIGLAVISLAELYAGVYYSDYPVRAKKELDNFLSSVTVLGVNEGICRIFGEENARLRRGGQLIEDFDLLIAATCLYHGLKLLTNNRQHFERIEGLEIISANR
jgi:tRNA(fMet)-specific endonuclease VapC